MTEFKQIIGRGTRIEENHDKMYFTILDFRNASIMFSDPKFNGPELQDDEYDPDATPVDVTPLPPKDIDPVEPPRGKKKIYVKDVAVELVSERVQYYDKDGKLVTESLKDFTRKNILSGFASLDDFMKYWTSEERRSVIIQELKEHGVFLEELRSYYPANVDDFDLICDIAYGIKPLTKSERAKRRKVDEVLAEYSDSCKKVLEIILLKYSNDNIDELTDTRILKLPEFNEFGNPMKIAKLFGGMSGYVAAVREIQNALYVA